MTILGVSIGDDLRAARERARLTQPQLAAILGVGPRTVGNWENGHTVPKNRLAAIQQFIADHERDEDDNPLRSVSDSALLAEIAKRFGHGSASRRESGI